MPQFEIKHLTDEQVVEIESELLIDEFKGDVTCTGVDYASNRTKNINLKFAKLNATTKYLIVNDPVNTECIAIDVCFCSMLKIETT